MTILENLQHVVVSATDPTKRGLIVLNPDGTAVASVSAGITQYTSGNTQVATPTGDVIIFSNGTTWQSVDSTHGFPVNVVAGAAGGGVAQVQVRSNVNAWTDVGYNAGDLNLPVQIQTALPTGSNVIGGVTSADGSLVSIGTTTDAASANTVIGRLKAQLALYPTAAALADATGNPTLTGIQVFPMGYNGTTWDRLKSTLGSLNVHLDAQTVTISGTVNQGTAAALSGKWPVQITDGTNTMPTGDAAARTIHVTADNTTLAVTQSTTPWAVAGNVATGAAASGNPILAGLRIATTNPTAGSDTNVVYAMGDKYGRPVVALGAPVDLVLDGSAVPLILTTTTETTLDAAGGAGVFHDLVAIWAVNTSATGTRVDIRDATAGSVKFPLYVPAGDMRGVVLTRPKYQAAANNNWTAQLGTAVTDVRIYAQFEKRV